MGYSRSSNQFTGVWRALITCPNLSKSRREPTPLIYVTIHLLINICQSEPSSDVQCTFFLLLVLFLATRHSRKASALLAFFIYYSTIRTTMVQPAHWRVTQQENIGGLVIG